VRGEKKPCLFLFRRFFERLFYVFAHRFQKAGFVIKLFDFFYSRPSFIRERVCSASLKTEAVVVVKIGGKAAIE
jgi:hypothetical protein